jgi:acyl-CoA thioester hydrolase
MARYHYSCPMRWSDMDAYGHVNNVQFLTYLEEARIDMLHDVIERAKERDGPLAGGILVARSTIEYRRPLVHRKDPVPITMWVSKVGAAYFDLAHEVSDPDVVYARATSRLVPYDFRVERPRRLHAEEQEFLRGYLEADAGYLEA